MNWVLWHWASLLLRFTVSRSSSTRAQVCFWLFYTTVQLVQKRTVTSAAMFVILLCSATSQGRKQRRMTLNEKKIKPAVCDLRLNGLISAMSASCSLPLSLLPIENEFCILCSPHITASSSLFLHLYLAVKEQDVHQFWTSSEIKQGREDMFNSDFSLKWLIAFIKWHQQQYD